MPPRLRSARLKPSFSSPSCFPKGLSRAEPCRPFATTQAQSTRLRRSMFNWLRGPGAQFRNPIPGSTNYLNAYDSDGKPRRRQTDNSTSAGTQQEGQELDQDEIDSSDQGGLDPRLPREDRRTLQPFPKNSAFASQNVLSEELREEIYQKVVHSGKSVKVVSAEFGVEMNRVGAVVRLKSIEKDWISKGKPLAIPYSKAVLQMLPTTPLVKYPGRIAQHESINDLPVHPATTRQIFEPVSESRSFTRVDASKAFDPTLLPADKRIPHPELIELEKERLLGIPQEERRERQRQRASVEAKKREYKDLRRKEIEEATLKTVLPADKGGNGGRWEWRFTETSVQDAGKDGRAPGGVGWRYGVPHEDRKKGQIKIPTSV